MAVEAEDPAIAEGGAVGATGVGWSIPAGGAGAEVEAGVASLGRGSAMPVAWT